MAQPQNIPWYCMICCDWYHWCTWREKSIAFYSQNWFLGYSILFKQIFSSIFRIEMKMTLIWRYIDNKKRVGIPIKINTWQVFDPTQCSSTQLDPGLIQLDPVPSNLIELDPARSRSIQAWSSSIQPDPGSILLDPTRSSSIQLNLARSSSI